MKIVFNIGNTNITAGVFSGDNIAFKIRLRTNINYTEDQYFSVFYTLLKRENIEPSDIDTAVIGSVVPAITRVIGHMVRKYFRVEPFLITGKTRFNFRNMYKNPSDVGDDRLANTAEAIRLYGKRDMVIIDIGTGTTFDVVSGSGCYLGGIILPGLNLMLQSLFTKTAKLPQVNLKFPGSIIGNSTEEAIQSGLLNGLVGSVNYLLAGIRKEMKIKKIKVILTGGDSDLIPCSKIDAKDILVDKDLTLKGFKYISDLNSGRPLKPGRGHEIHKKNIHR
jgi:type III pantothenate kinase